MLLSRLLSTQILMTIRQRPFEMKYIIFLVARVLSACLLPCISLSERMFTIGDTKAAYKTVMGYFPSSTVSPAWLGNVVVTILNGLERHILQDKQLPPGILSLPLGTMVSNTMFHLVS